MESHTQHHTLDFYISSSLKPTYLRYSIIIFVFYYSSSLLLLLLLISFTVVPTNNANTSTTFINANTSRNQNPVIDPNPSIGEADSNTFASAFEPSVGGCQTVTPAMDASSNNDVVVGETFAAFDIFTPLLSKLLFLLFFVFILLLLEVKGPNA